MNLTNKQKVFCDEYLVDLNATQAAIRAGYSEKTAKVIGCENLTKPDINEYIAKAQQARKERTEIDADYVLHGIKSIIEDATKMKKDIDGNEGMTDRSAALRGQELLGRHFALFTDKQEINGKGGVPLNMIITKRVITPDKKE